MRIENVKIIHKLRTLKKEYKEKAMDVIKQHASNTIPYKKGDVVEDHFQIGEILSTHIVANIQTNTYTIFFKCVRLTKKLKPFKQKNKEYAIIYLENIKRKIR